MLARSIFLTEVVKWRYAASGSFLYRGHQTSTDGAAVDSEMARQRAFAYCPFQFNKDCHQQSVDVCPGLSGRRGCLWVLVFAVLQLVAAPCGLSYGAGGILFLGGVSVKAFSKFSSTLLYISQSPT